MAWTPIIPVRGPNRICFQIGLVKCMHACSVAQSYLTLCDHMDYSPPGSSVHGILQARILDWVAVSSCRVSSQPRDQTCISLLIGRPFFMTSATWEACQIIVFSLFLNLLLTPYTSKDTVEIQLHFDFYSICVICHSFDNYLCNIL